MIFKQTNQNAGNVVNGYTESQMTAAIEAERKACADIADGYRDDDSQKTAHGIRNLILMRGQK